MEKGIFSKVFAKYPLVEALEKIHAYGFSTVQFNFANIGLPSLPTNVSDENIEEIITAFQASDISTSIISGTFNTLELDSNKRKQNVIGFENVVKTAKALNVPYVSISTGSFNQEDFWSPHPDNHTEKGWKYLYDSLDEMVKIALLYGVTIVVEPEQANVVSTVKDTMQLMNYYNSPYLKVLYDPANIVTTNDVNQLEETISYSLKELSPYIEMAHYKDCFVTEDCIKFAPVGKGNLPLNYYLQELKKYYDGPIIMHGLNEEDIEHALKSIIIN